MSEQCKYCKVRGLKEFISKKNGKPYFRWVGDSEIHTYEECRSIQSKSTTWVDVIKKHNSEAAAGLTKNNNSSEQTVQVQKPVEQAKIARIVQQPQDVIQDYGILLKSIWDKLNNMEKRQIQNEQVIDGIGQKVQLLIEKVGYPAPELIITESEQKVIDDVKPKETQQTQYSEKEINDMMESDAQAMEDMGIQKKEIEKQDKVKIDVHKTLLDVINAFGTANKQKLYAVTQGPYVSKEDVDGALDWLLFNNQIGIIENEEDGETIYTKIHEPTLQETKEQIDDLNKAFKKAEEKQRAKINYQDIDVNSWTVGVYGGSPNVCNECKSPKSKGLVNKENGIFLCEGDFLKHYTHDDFKKITGIDEKPVSEYEKDTKARARTLEQINEIEDQYGF